LNICCALFCNFNPSAAAGLWRVASFDRVWSIGPEFSQRALPLRDGVEMGGLGKATKHKHIQTTAVSQALVGHESASFAQLWR
jgi:hypothetical protein